MFVCEDAFSRNSSLEYIEVVESFGNVGKKKYKSLDGVLFTEDGKTLVQYPGGKPDEVYEVPDSVERIDQFAFKGNKKLRNVIIQNGTEVIGKCAFLDCTELQGIDIPNSVRDIYENAFLHCNNLTIYAPADSEAEQYARIHRINYIRTLE